MTTTTIQINKDLPAGWKISDLNSIVDINPESCDPAQKPYEKFSYIDIDSVENGSGIITGVKELLGKDAPSRARRVVKTDDVIMSEVRPYLKAFALVPKKFNNQICSTGFAVLRSKGTVDPKYLLNVLFSKEVIDQCNRMMVGAQYPALNDSQVKKIQTLLPPLPEQRRIATILTTIDDAIQRSRQAAAETERFKAGVMHELMTKGIGHTEFIEDPDIGMVPKDWNVAPLSENMSILSGQYFELADFCDIGTRCLKIDNVGYGNIHWDLTTYLPKKFVEKYPNLVLKPDDIVIALNRPITNDKLKIGILSTNDAPSLLYQRVGKFEFTNDQLDKKFIFFLFNSEYFKKSVKKSLIGTDQPYIRTPVLLKIKIPIPPFAEQRRITSILTTVSDKLTLQRQRTAHYEKLKQGLMNELLTGKRRVKVG